MSDVFEYQSGYQGLNRMFGLTKHIPSGELVLVGGLPHNYKTELLHALLRHMATSTSPATSESKAIPTILFFLGDSTSESQLHKLFTDLKEDETGTKVDSYKYTAVDIIDYVNSRLASQGWHVGILDLPHKETTVLELRSILEDYVESGHDIKVAFIDDIANNVSHDDTRALMRNVRELMKELDILTIATHPVSMNLIKLRREMGDSFLSHLPESNLWAGDSRLSQEVDLEIFVNIVQRGDNFYLELQRGKHRTLPITPEEDRHVYLPFTALGHLPFDVGVEDRSVSVIPE